MLISIDLGGSTIDLIIFDEQKNIQQKHSFESAQTDRSDLLGILEKAEIEIEQITKLRITGGYSLHLPEKLENIRIEKIPEFDANGFGGKYLAQTDNCLVVSLGTGTSMVKVVDGKTEHIGGTGIGGGTLIGLGKLLLNETSHHKIDQLAQKGNLANVDLSVQDIVGGEIGILPGNATASNFGKSYLDSRSLRLRSGSGFESFLSEVEGNGATREDLALGLCNLIGETVGSIAYFASQKYNLEKIVLIGKVTRVKSILKIIQSTSKVYDKEILVPGNADFGTAIGAGLI